MQAPAFIIDSAGNCRKELLNPVTIFKPAKKDSHSVCL